MQILDVRKSQLPSGITLITQAMPDRHTVSVGVWVRTGSRDERHEHLGLAHFIEHMMFKGTEARDARAIASSLESLGGHLDAFTTREQVCYCARSLAEHLPQAIDVLADIICRSLFDADEIEREKLVIHEEIDSYEDNPEEKISDLLAEQIWGDHPLGRPILGTVGTIAAFDPGLLRRDTNEPLPGGPADPRSRGPSRARGTGRTRRAEFCAPGGRRTGARRDATGLRSGRSPRAA